MSWSSVVVEADGASRGNPGPAAYGAVLKDAATGEVIAERAETLGVVSNNVAEYRGLIAGLELAAHHAPDAALEVRMDSKLVVEQMSGRWRIKHPAMVPLAEQARGLAPAGATYTWVPRAENGHADRLGNEALDGKRDLSGPTPTPAADPIEAAPGPRPTAPSRGWAPKGGPPTTVVLVRHGVTAHTGRKLFSGGLASANPGLTDEGRAQVRATAEWLTPMAEGIDAVIASPVRRTRESAEIVAAVLGLDHETLPVEPGLAEMEYGAWDGLSFAEVKERWPDDMAQWLGSMDVAPGGPDGGGESFRVVEERVLAGRDRLLETHAGQTIVAVSHVTPIKTLVADALGAPLEAVYRMELSPASVTVISYWRDDQAAITRPSLRLYNARPTDFAV